MITMFPRITEQVVKYPITGDYDINIWCDNDTEHPRGYWVVNLTFYPLIKGEEYDTVNTSVFYTLTLPAITTSIDESEALAYLRALVEDEVAFDTQYTDWWSNECVLTDPPSLIADFMATLPRGA